MFTIPLLKGRSGRHASRHARKLSRTRPRARRLCHEPLEQRTLLSLGSISGTVFEDLDANGVQGPADPGLADWTVVLERLDTPDPVLTIPNPAPNVDDQFGFHIATMGNNVLVGAPREDVGGLTNVGAAYLFDGSTGALLQTFADPDPEQWDMFGSSITAVGNNILVGTRRDVALAERPAQTGTAYLFDIDGNLLAGGRPTYGHYGNFTVYLPGKEHDFFRRGQRAVGSPPQGQYGLACLSQRLHLAQ